MIADIDKLKEDVSALTGETNDLDNEVDQILDKLNDLLAESAVIDGDLFIRNLGELEIAKELLNYGDDDPLVSVTGGVHVILSEANGLDDSLAVVNAITRKIRTVQQTVTVTTDFATNFEALAFVNGDYSLTGTGDVTDGELVTVNGTARFNIDEEVISYPKLRTAGAVQLSETATITAVDFSTLATGVVYTGMDTTTLELPLATSVKVGQLPETVTAPNALIFVSNGASEQGTTTINVDGSTEFSLAATSFIGDVTITTSGTVDISQVTSARGLIINATSIDASGLEDFTGITVLAAPTVNIEGMETSSAQVTVDGPSSINLPNLTTLGAVFSAPEATTFTAPQLTATSTGVVSLNGTNTLIVEVKTIDTSNPPDAAIIPFVNVRTLTVKEQAGDLDVSTGTALTTLNFTGELNSPVTQGGQTNALTVTSANASLTTLNIGDGGIGTLSIDNTALTTLSTNGVILNTVVTNNAGLASFDFAHRYINGEFATSVRIENNVNPGLTSIDLSSLAKVKEVIISGNTSLTTITAPKYATADDLAEPVATVTVTIFGNNTVGSYAAANAPTETTPYRAPEASAAVVSSFKGFIEAYLAQSARTASVTFNIDIDNVDADESGAYDDGMLSALLDADTAAQAGANGIAGDADDDSDNDINPGTGVSSVRELAIYE